MITYIPKLGQTIHSAAQEMVDIFIREGVRVVATFNDAPTVADAGMVPDDVVKVWNKTKKRVWARKTKLTANSDRRRWRKKQNRDKRRAWAFVDASNGRKWGADPVADLLFIEPWLGCLGWT